MKKIILTMLFVLSVISASAQIIFWGNRQYSVYENDSLVTKTEAAPLAIYNITDIDSIAFSEDLKVPADYPQVSATDGYVTIVWNIDDSFSCNGFAFAGNYNYWNTSFSTYLVEDVTYAPLSVFEKIEDNWYKCLVPTDKLSTSYVNSEYVEGKCGQLSKDGSWPWDYQWSSAQKLWGNAEINIDSYSEISIQIPKDAGVVYVASNDFKSNACLEKTVNATITIETTVPVTNNGVVYIVGNAFEQSWDPTAYPMTKVDDSHWTITLPATTGKEFKFCVNGDWSNDQVSGLEAGCPVIANNTILTDTTMNLTVYGFVNYGVESCY